MIAMSVVSHQCVAGISDARGDSTMEEEVDLLSRLRYLRQTLQDCHLRVSVLDERVEALHPVLNCNPNEVRTPTQNQADENGPYDFINGSQADERVTKTQEHEDDSHLHNGENEVNNLCHYESDSPRSKLQDCLPDNHLRHLAQKHASELYNMYWSYSVDKDNDQECSLETRQSKKAVTWGDNNYIIFSSDNETCVQNGTNHLESFTTSGDCNDVDESYPDNPVWVEFHNYDRSNDKAYESATEVNEKLTDENKYTSVSQHTADYYCKTQLSRNLTSKTGKPEVNIEDYMADSESSKETRIEEQTEVSRKETVPQSILNNIKNPWFRNAQAVENDSRDILHSKRRKHFLIRTKKTDLDDQDVENPSKTNIYVSERNDEFNLCKSVEVSERLPGYDGFTGSDEIIFKDESSLEVNHEETEGENCFADELIFKDVNCLEVNAEETESNSGSECEIIFKDVNAPELTSEASDSDIDFEESENISKVIHPETVRKPEPDILEKLNVIGECLEFFSRSIFALCSDSEHPSKDEDSHQHSNIHQEYPERYHTILSEDVEYDGVGFSKMPLASCFMNSVLTSDKQNKVELNNNKDAFAYQQRLCQLTDDSLVSSDTTREESSKNAKSSSNLEIERGSNADSVLNQYFSVDLKSMIIIFIMFLLLFAALFIIYLLIAVPLLVVSVRHNGSSVAF